MKSFKVYSREFAKKISFATVTLLAAINIVGCSTDDTITNVPTDSAVLFNTYIARNTPTRAALASTSSLQNEGFGVFAYYTQQASFDATSSNPNFMNNQKVAYNSGTAKWAYTPLKYWPNNDGAKLTFLGYAPWVAGRTITQGNIDFTVNSTIASQEDLLYADATHLKNITKQVTSAAVDFQFKHALSRISFSAKAAADYGTTTIKIKSVSIAGSFYQSAKLNLADGTWGSYGAASTRKYEPSFKSDFNGHVTTTETIINADNQYIMIVPQNFANTDKIAIEVKYTTITNFGTALAHESAEKTVTENLNYDFQQSKAYNFKLNMSLDAISFGVSFVDWGAETDSPIEV